MDYQRVIKLEVLRVTHTVCAQGMHPQLPPARLSNMFRVKSSICQFLSMELPTTTIMFPCNLPVSIDLCCSN